MISGKEDAAMAGVEEEKNDSGIGLISVLANDAALLGSATMIFADELAFLEEDACAMMIAD